MKVSFCGHRGVVCGNKTRGGSRGVRKAQESFQAEWGGVQQMRMSALLCMGAWLADGSV